MEEEEQKLSHAARALIFLLSLICEVTVFEAANFMRQILAEDACHNVEWNVHLLHSFVAAGKQGAY